jgi:hypothetical protein
MGLEGAIYFQPFSVPHQSSSPIFSTNKSLNLGGGNLVINPDKAFAAYGE